VSDGFHHGDLRRVLLEASMDLVRERGVDGFTLREVARRAGVSHNAPYHHFRDRSALVAALVVDGFEDFTEVLERAADRARGGDLARIRALGLAYVRYARHDPGRFTLLWRPGLREGANLAEVEAAGERSYQPLVQALAWARASGTVSTAVGPEEQALAAWSTVHGFAMLLIDGPLRVEAIGDREADRLTKAVLDTLVEGLAAR
jgi:AcrR family transcriptional regulator